MNLAIILPGIGYTGDKPLLYYSRRIAVRLGYEVLDIRYSGFPQNVLGDSDKMAACYRIALEQAGKQLPAIQEEDEVLFIGKSIGTVLAARFADRLPCGSRLVLYTPMEDIFRYSLRNAIVFTGSADPWVKAPIGPRCLARRIPCTVVPDGNHSLECGDPLRDMEALLQVMRQTTAFLTAGQQRSGRYS